MEVYISAMFETINHALINGVTPRNMTATSVFRLAAYSNKTNWSRVAKALFRFALRQELYGKVAARG